jgi:hypothetical protein
LAGLTLLGGGAWHSDTDPAEHRNGEISGDADASEIIDSLDVVRDARTAASALRVRLDKRALKPLETEWDGTDARND